MSRFFVPYQTNVTFDTINNTVNSTATHILLILFKVDVSFGTFILKIKFHLYNKKGCDNHSPLLLQLPLTVGNTAFTTSTLR